MSENKWNLVAPCGLYCGECTAFIDGRCGGCRSNKGLSKEYRKYCKIYKCSYNKNIRICLDCRKFPCKLFYFFRAERLEESSWFLDVWVNMKQIKGIGVERFLRRRESWLRRRKRCAEKRGIKGCDECKQWPCELLKRPVLVPVDLEKFKKFMEEIEEGG